MIESTSYRLAIASADFKEACERLTKSARESTRQFTLLLWKLEEIRDKQRTAPSAQADKAIDAAANTNSGG